ncbi:helix-turn-helix domain-containing protein [Nocardia cyriacigeorgica]|uniref:helix-turn-helix domain-containing protein n=1 Tax=Nocardia cyriacigeorgica TaxID=135487 RepID=UPI0013D744DC|nr:helix-turn-helix transcriptional regulator [Nocardia cyriacigeorgica]MBF6435504.1 helix-turn-helix transcriptional regulator [Nocardia cyriacigeorgica]MBF6454417.1 helix-turn-helix transcriptional regulator [Nocardia cyriacigeorgica]MBF6478083.1 helix-turn-helix transcriptional regulator [Nocardia cyriacigeorgica]MBF6552311.1 helix-turn-helix transcriptional regulator [Nocardia cyriacigeorgica]NEW25961.1 helix-turn-helix transcriptional regulator [Nocardia cyriacigeorgica]
MTTTGDRIAGLRKLAGLKQVQLAQRARYSVSMVRAVEQNREPASPGFVAAVAGVLGVEPEYLTGTPYYELIEEDGPLEGLAELRSVLAEGPYVRPIEPAPLPELAAEMAAIDLAYRNDKGRWALARIPVLLRQLYGALHAAPDGERGPVLSLLCAAHVTTERLCRRFGFTNLAPSVLDRLEWAAAQADDPLYAAQAKIKRARILMYHNANDVGMPLVEQALDMIEGDTQAANAVRGYGHLCGAIVAARGIRPDVAADHLRHAQVLAPRMRGESDLYGTLFGPANVGIHSCAVALESGDPDRAARQGSALELPAGIAPPRAGHHWQDVARAWVLVGQPDKALRALYTARAAAPQQTRLHPSVRETVYAIASAQRRRSDNLLGFAHWLGASL